VRQLLADKLSGNQVGIWLLAPEHLRLGSWELLCAWSQSGGETVEPRLALHLVHEAALCVAGLRRDRSLSQKGFELANGLPFVPSDPALHELLGRHSLADAQFLQVALGKVRRASGHFPGRLLAIDPHRIQSATKRQMRRRQGQAQQKPTKMVQCFFCLDVESAQPLCFTLASSAQTVAQATPELLALGEQILQPPAGSAPLVLADSEPYTAELIDAVHLQTPFELLVPMPQPASKRPAPVPAPERFTPRWAGYATAKEPYRLKRSRSPEPYYRILQRSGERPEQYAYKAFLATTDRDEVQDLTCHYPQRWRVEEFFKCNQALGWQRAGTLNLHIRYGQMSLALLAQAALHQLRQRLGEPFCHWDATHFARHLFGGLEGDVRVKGDTILVTYYNAPHSEGLRRHYENLPDQLHQAGIDPKLPWLYGFQLDFRFR
jgi:Transposase DDE domain